MPITSSRAQHLWSALSNVYELLGFDEVAEGDEAFRQLVLARIIEPTSKVDSLRVIDEAGIAPVSDPTLNRRPTVFAKPFFRQLLSADCAAHAQFGPASLVLFDVSTLYFETDAGDGFREPGFSKGRRLELQITLGLLTDASGMPLMVEAVEGNKAETATMPPVITAFKKAHQLVKSSACRPRMSDAIISAAPQFYAPVSCRPLLEIPVELVGYCRLRSKREQVVPERQRAAQDSTGADNRYNVQASFVTMPRNTFSRYRSGVDCIP